MVQGKNNFLASQLLVCCCVKLSLEGHFTFLPPRVMGQQATSTDLTRFCQQTISTWQLLTIEGSPPNKLQALFLRKWSKKNLAFSKHVTSSRSR
jgi:hypothetical protein